MGLYELAHDEMDIERAEIEAELDAYDAWLESWYDDGSDEQDGGAL